MILTNDNFPHVLVPVFVFDMSAETRLKSRYSYLCGPAPMPPWRSMSCSLCRVDNCPEFRKFRNHCRQENVSQRVVRLAHTPLQGGIVSFVTRTFYLLVVITSKELGAGNAKLHYLSGSGFSIDIWE